MVVLAILHRGRLLMPVADETMLLTLKIKQLHSFFFFISLLILKKSLSLHMISRCGRSDGHASTPSRTNGQVTDGKVRVTSLDADGRDDGT